MEDFHEVKCVVGGALKLSSERLECQEHVSICNFYKIKIV